MRRDNILLVTYDFPPGLSGVRRVVKFAKYLPEFGFDPMVLAAQPDEGLPLDREALAEVEAQGYPVHRTPSLDAYQARRHLRHAADRFRRAAEAPSAPGAPDAPPPPGALARAGAAAVRGMSRWLLLPDDRVGWLPFARGAAHRILRSQPVRFVLTSSYPNSSHLVGRWLKRRFKVKWIADFRDGWTQNPYFAKYPTPLHRALDLRLEAAVAREADAILAVSEPIAEHLRRAGGGARVRVIPNGYDTDDLRGIQPVAFDRFTLAYTGTLFMHRSPENFFAAVRGLLDNHPGIAGNFQVVFRSRFKPEHEAAVRDLGLEGVVRNLGMGTHREALQLQASADALLVLEGDAPNAEIMLTQKIFEYLAADKPVLAVAPHGALADLVRRVRAGVVVAPDNVFQIKERLFELFNGQVRHDPDRALVARFHRRELARELAGVLDDLRR
jgi:glycosyltransferase involved in cell wall biosynthesis